ncbi:hypothetical protein [Pseudomonas luteola]|uniref:hypothetical protein n=1 Tax=Pseudomonas luteola TaxID=47886 RepID=UPI000F78805B|nr:hypothetical protein [Pseudomonas luteola]
MKMPSFEILVEGYKTKSYQSMRFTRGVHPNVFAYKYYWWVFHRDSPCEGETFLGETYQLATAAAHELMGQLQRAGEPYWLYNKRLRRLPSAGSPPWNTDAPQWKDAEWAPAYPDDPDPPYQGHK